MPGFLYGVLLSLFNPLSIAFLLLILAALPPRRAVVRSRCFGLAMAVILIGGNHWVTGGMLRVPAGEAVGVEPASDPVKRIMVNVGDAPRAPGCWWQPGKARCRLMGAGRVGVRVVVRGRESRPHGEGGQQDRGVRRCSGGRA